MGQFLSLWNKLTMRQRLSIGAAVVLLVGGIYSFVTWQKERDFQPLFENLAPEEAGQIVGRLKEAGIEVRLSEGGTRILVPSAHVAEQRLTLAAQGLPQTGRIGFEIFDQNNFGVTDFTEHVNYQRAIEGELERSLTTIQEIERARVHITFAKDSVFLENRQPAKGSVMVKLKPGVTLEKRQVSAISHLVASAVEGLRPEQVSILDMKGNLLSQPAPSESAGGLEPPEAILQFQRRLEEEFQRKLVSTLDPLLGRDRYRSSVAVDLEMTSGNESSEVFDPDRSVMTTTQKQEDVSSSTGTGGVAGTGSNLPSSVSARGAASARGAGGGVVRRSETVAFQTSRTVRNMVVPQGVLKRISVAVLVDQKLRWDGTGPEARRVLEAPDEQTMETIRELVTGAIGLLDERGDQLVVESLPFETTITEPPPQPEPVPEAPGTPDSPLTEWLSLLPADVPLWVWCAAGGGAVLLLLAWVLLLLRKRRSRVKILPSQATLPGLARTQLQNPEGRTNEDGPGLEAFIHQQQELLKEKESAALASLKGAKVPKTHVEVLTGHLVESVAQDPASAAQILRSWLTEDRR